MTCSSTTCGLLQVLETGTQGITTSGPITSRLLRQVLENIASFLGVGHFGMSLSKSGSMIRLKWQDIMNVLSHKKVYYYESDLLVPGQQGNVRDGL